MLNIHCHVSSSINWSYISADHFVLLFIDTGGWAMWPVKMSLKWPIVSGGALSLIVVCFKLLHVWSVDVRVCLWRHVRRVRVCRCGESVGSSSEGRSCGCDGTGRRGRPPRLLGHCFRSDISHSAFFNHFCWYNVLLPILTLLRFICKRVKSDNRSSSSSSSS